MFLELPNDILIIIVGYSIQNYKSLLYVNTNINKITQKYLYGFSIHFNKPLPFYFVRDEKKSEEINFKLDLYNNISDCNYSNVYITSNIFYSNSYYLQINIKKNIVYFKAIYNNIKKINIVQTLIFIARAIICYDPKYSYIICYMLENRHVKKEYIIDIYTYISLYILQMNNIATIEKKIKMIYHQDLSHMKFNKPYEMHKLCRDNKHSGIKHMYKHLGVEDSLYINCPKKHQSYYSYISLNDNIISYDIFKYDENYRDYMLSNQIQFLNDNFFYSFCFTEIICQNIPKLTLDLLPPVIMSETFNMNHDGTSVALSTFPTDGFDAVAIFCELNPINSREGSTATAYFIAVRYIIPVDLRITVQFSSVGRYRERIVLTWDNNLKVLNISLDTDVSRNYISPTVPGKITYHHGILNLK